VSRTALLVVIILFPGVVFAIDAILSPAGPEPGLTAVPISRGGLVGNAGEPLPSPLTLRVLDLQDRARAAVRVDWRIAGGSGTLTSVDELTNLEGIATARWTLGPEVGPQMVQAVVPQAADSLVTFRAVARAGPPVRLERIEESRADPSVRVVDRYGNPVAQVLVTWEVRRGSGAMRPDSTMTNDQGIASSAWVAAGSGRDSILAVSESLVGSPVSFVRQRLAPPPPPEPLVVRDTLPIVPDTLARPDTMPVSPDS